GGQGEIVRAVGTAESHFVLAVLRTKQAESARYENHNSPISKFTEPVAHPVCIFAQLARACLFRAFAKSTSGLSTRMRPSQRPHVSRSRSHHSRRPKHGHRPPTAF